MRIPDRLAHLRTDDRGRPVPYVNRWGHEDVQNLSIAYDVHVEGLAVFDDDSEYEIPDFKRQSMWRQRRCVAAGLCQVCGRPVPWSRRFLVISGMSVEWVYVESVHRTLPVVVEPWLDEQCAEFAMKRCPALIRRTRDDDLQLVRVRSQREALLIVSRGWIEGPLEEESRLVQPAMWCKIALTGVKILRREEPSDAIR